VLSHGRLQPCKHQACSAKQQVREARSHKREARSHPQNAGQMHNRVHIAWSEAAKVDDGMHGLQHISGICAVQRGCKVSIASHPAACARLHSTHEFCCGRLGCYTCCTGQTRHSSRAWPVPELADSSTHPASMARIRRAAFTGDMEKCASSPLSCSTAAGPHTLLLSAVLEQRHCCSLQLRTVIAQRAEGVPLANFEQLECIPRPAGVGQAEHPGQLHGGRGHSLKQGSCAGNK
jgi:hypothetical protein